MMSSRRSAGGLYFLDGLDSDDDRLRTLMMIRTGNGSGYCSLILCFLGNSEARTLTTPKTHVHDASIVLNTEAQCGLPWGS